MLGGIERVPRRRIIQGELKKNPLCVYSSGRQNIQGGLDTVDISGLHLYKQIDAECGEQQKGGEKALERGP